MIKKAINEIENKLYNEEDINEIACLKKELKIWHIMLADSNPF